MNPYTFHINLYDLVFLGAIFIGLTFSLLLWVAKKVNRTANRFLALALATIVLWLTWVLGIDTGLSNYFPHWSRLPLQFSLALGPLIYFYVLRITRPGYKLRWKDLLHFIPLLLQLGIFVLQLRENVSTGAATYDTLVFREINQVFNLAAFVSVSIYLYWSFKLIERYYLELKFNTLNDRYRYQMRWLYRLLTAFGLLWLLWIPYMAVDYFYFYYQLSAHAYYPLYLLLTGMMIWIAATVHLKPEVAAPGLTPPVSKPVPPLVLRQKGIWLKNTMKHTPYYQDPELSLVSLADKLGLTVHELSRIINVGLKKNFNDFINSPYADLSLKIRSSGIRC